MDKQRGCSYTKTDWIGDRFSISADEAIPERKNIPVSCFRPDRMASILLSTAFWAFVLITSIGLFPLAVLIKLLTFLFDKKLVILHLFTCFWASLYTWINPNWKIRISGREKIEAGKAYIIVCNHQSLVDILVLFRLFVHFKWVSKVENFRVPFVGWNMRLNRYIQIVRSSLKSQGKMMKDAQAALERGSSVLIFPEGTRSLTGKLRPFKAGAFQLALKTGKPILPIVLNGSADALPKAGIRLSGQHEIRVKVLDEISGDSVAGQSTKELSKTVSALIAAELEKLQQDAWSKPSTV